MKRVSCVLSSDFHLTEILKIFMKLLSYILSLYIPSYVSKNRGHCFLKKKKEKRMRVILKHMA